MPLTEPEKFKTRNVLENHLKSEHHYRTARKVLRLWTIAELVEAHEKGHSSE